MANIRLKKGQVDPNNPQATSVKGAATLKNIVIDNVVIASTRRIDLMAEPVETNEAVAVATEESTAAEVSETKPSLAKNKNGHAWWVSGTTADGKKYSGIQYAWLGHPAMDFFAKSLGVKFVSSAAVKPSNMDPDACEQLGITEYR